MRRDIREGVKQFMHDDLKPNFAAIVRQYGADYRTVKQAFTELNQDAQCKGSAKKHRTSLLDNYRHVIKAKLEDNCSAMAIFKFIQKKGFTGKYSIVRDYCRTIKQNRIHKATIRVEHTAGLSAQVELERRANTLQSRRCCLSL